MSEIKKIVADIETVFAESSYPPDFLSSYDQMECLANHSGRETFLVRRKSDGLHAVAKCYDRKLIPLLPDITLLQRLEGDGFPAYYEKFENERMVCVVREYVEGTPLSRYAREKQLDKTEILAIAVQLCRILENMHGRKPPVIHRDIKPENIIVRPNGSVVLIDFDISREYKPGAETDTVMFGTKGYAPPEQYGFEQTDQKADIYSFGVLLRWLMTGNVRPNRNVLIDTNIQHVIDRCTAFAPEDRYDSIRQVRNDIENASRKKLQISRGKFLKVGFAAVLFLCLGFLLGRFTDLFRPVPKISPITFTEPLIEAAVRSQLGVDPNIVLSAEMLSTVKGIYIFGTDVYADPMEFFSQSRDDHTFGPIHTLDDLTLLPNLEELHIVLQENINISALARMEKLKVVELRHVRLADIYPLTDIKMLREALLFDSGLSDISALQSCHWLETLDVGYNAINSMAQIGEHPYLRSLCLRGLRMAALDGIEMLPNLRIITLAKASIDDLTALTKLNYLEEIYATRGLMNDLAALEFSSDVKIIQIDD